MNVKARGGYEYFISFIDDYSRYDYVYLMHHKYDSLEKFKKYKAEIENELGKTIKMFRSHRGGEYVTMKEKWDIHSKIRIKINLIATKQFSN